MKKILKVFRKSVIALFLFVVVYILFLNFTNIFSQKSYFVFLIIPVLLIFIYFLSKIKRIKNKKVSFFISFLFILIITLILLYIGFKTRVNSTWDYHFILKEVYKYVNGVETRVDYFARYPNNIPLFLVQIFLAKIGQLYNPLITATGIQSITIIVNALIIVFSIFLLRMIANKVVNRRAANILLIISLLYCPLYLYTTIMYTDTIGMLFNVISLFLFYVSLVVRNKKIKLLSNIFLVLAVVIGFKFKATNIFILIAIIMQLLYDKSIRKICFLMFFTIISNLFLGVLIDNAYPISDDEIDRYNFPYTHWVMMSLNPKTKGGYIEEDVQYSKSFITMEDRKKGINERLKERINNYSTAELLNRVLYLKPINTWGNPCLGSDDYLQRNPKEWNYINKTVTFKQENYKYYKIYVSAVYLIIIVGMFISGIVNFNDNNKFIFISQITLIGIFAFELLWETHARYVYTFLPFMLLCASYGYAKIFDIFKGGEKYEK